jgi:hypothetical protein
MTFGMRAMLLAGFVAVALFTGPLGVYTRMVRELPPLPRGGL